MASSLAMFPRCQRTLLYGCLLLLAACGGDGSAAPPAAGEAAIGTLAYVVTDCEATGGVVTLRQSLLLRHADRDPVTVAEIPPIGPARNAGLCAAYGAGGDGFAGVIAGALQRLGVTPDGTAVVFEVTDEFSVLAPNRLAEERKGIFSVRADGTGLRRIAPASREACFRAPPAGEGGGLSRLPHFAFSPSGRMVAYTDLGPGPNGQDTIQIATLDLNTGERRIVTHLRAPFSPVASQIPTCCPFFLNERTILFATVINPGGISVGTRYFVYRVDVDGSNFAPIPFPIDFPESPLVPLFTITGADRVVGLLPSESGDPEVFVADGTNVLQLTTFARPDTSTPLIDGSRERVFFAASANPFETNPEGACQIFSIDVLGADLRQLTQFPGTNAVHGCGGPPEACQVLFLGPNIPSIDRDTGTMVFYSTCDPFRTSPTGGQLYAMRPDGSGLRQITNTRGWLKPDNGNASVQLPGPYAYGPYR